MVSFCCSRTGLCFARVENGNGATVTVRNRRIQCRTAQGRAAYCCTKVLKSPKRTLVDECTVALNELVTGI